MKRTQPKSSKAKTDKKPKADLPPMLDAIIPEDIPQDAEVNRLTKKMSFRQKIWADFYVKTLNKKKASLLAGCTEPNANNYSAYMWGLTHVRDYVQAVLNATLGGVEDNVKFIQNVRDASLNDYLSITKRTKSDLIEITLKEHIAALELRKNYWDDYLLDIATDPKEITSTVKTIKIFEKQIKEYRLELKYFPNKTMIVHGPEYIAEDVELDLVKLAKDRDGGIIKSFKTTKDGIQVEFYSALDAANTLARIQGSDKGVSPISLKTGPSVEELANLTEQDLREMTRIEKKMRGESI